jgi:hypothetical protein
MRGNVKSNLIRIKKGPHEAITGQLHPNEGPACLTEIDDEPISVTLMGNELDLVRHTSARRATRAAQGLEKALEASESRSSHLRGYTGSVRSANLPNGVNKIMTRFGQAAHLTTPMWAHLKHAAVKWL